MPSACAECRKRHGRCDGQQPCGNCRTAQVEDCVYETLTPQPKGQLRTDLEELRRRRSCSEHVLSALLQPQLREEVLARIRGHQSAETISEWLEAMLLSRDRFMPNLGQPEPKTGADLIPNEYGHSSADSKAEYEALGVRHPGPRGQQAGQDGRDEVPNPHDVPISKTAASTWTDVSTDLELVHHLLALYFGWEYHMFAFVSKEHFLKDFADGRHRYCSPILVNALLALACNYSTQADTCNTPDGPDPSVSGDHFFEEALALLDREHNHQTLTTVQALGIMSIREAGCGRVSEGRRLAGQCVRVALEMGLHQLPDDIANDELDVRCATFWGAFTLDITWALVMGSLPQSSAFLRVPPKLAMPEVNQTSLWVGNTYDGVPTQRLFRQPSNMQSLYTCYYELSELTHKSLYITYSPKSPATSKAFLDIYSQYLHWYDQMPDILRLGQNVTPAGMFIHMYYHIAVLVLFRPLIGLRIPESQTKPHDICLQASNAMLGLLRAYCQLHTFRKTPVFVPYFALTAAMIRLEIAHRIPTDKTIIGSVTPSNTTTPKFKSDIIEGVDQYIADLTEMVLYHGFAGQALSILRYRVANWHTETIHAPSTSVFTEEG